MTFEQLEADVASLQSSVAMLENLVQVQAGQIATLQSRPTLMLDANGHITGIVVSNNGVTSDFKIAADPDGSSQ